MNDGMGNSVDDHELTLEGVGSPVEDDLGRAERPAAPVVVDRGRLQFAELWEEFLDVGVRDAEVEVGHHELGGAAGRDAARPPAAAATAWDRERFMMRFELKI